ncbi:hypothetical protein [Amycolatopsis saalfeldensis]|uniref:Tat (Twin-arginine translocation) pathway signal sequence n=1 Tax=Amycolatopsis saalfeldensis TaxID=394193 RepID=A0A1H8U3I1_9PSEU|nr:hypothetical protein [Amycolatopsis saalfeldensis]SEO97647.1 hypothetical protein SAMN04489732_10348 [Amycolatopsis saalfeldensis]
MSTLRRRFLAGAVVPAAALGLLFAVPGPAFASTTAAPPAAESVTGHGHHRGSGLDLSILLGLHLGLGGHWHGGHCGLLGCYLDD